MFAIITPALAFGAAAERASLKAYIVFLWLWSTLVYDFVAYWTWNQNGWLFKLGDLDFAGGGPVHLASGTAALAYAIVIGKRENLKKQPPPHNIAHVLLGTSLLWFGWFGFNGGSELFSNGRAANACMATQMATSVAGLTWCALEYKYEKRITSLGFCTGCVVGLVVITPASGYVTTGSSIALGFLGVFPCYAMAQLKSRWPIDDAMDVFAIHGTGGAAGAILTGVFAQDWINTLDGSAPQQGWLGLKWNQIGIQIAAVLAIGAWSFTMSYIILKIMDRIPSLGLRLENEMEAMGSDFAIMGEEAYRHESYIAMTKASSINIFSISSPNSSTLHGLGVSSLNELTSRTQTDLVKRETERMVATPVRVTSSTQIN